MQLAQPEMERARGFPSTVNLVVIGDVLADAFKEVVSNCLTLGLFPKFWLDPVMSLSGQPVELCKSRQVVLRFEPL